MEWDDLFSKAASTLTVGGQETLYNSPDFLCAHQTHEPFRLYEKASRIYDQQQDYICGVVRTSGAQFDGDRTDIHDVFSLIWGAVLRAFGLGSVLLIDEPHGFAPGEIGARHLIINQCPWEISEGRFDEAQNSMNAWTSFAYHLLDDVFQWNRAGNTTRPDLATTRFEEKPIWMDQVNKYLRYPKETNFNKRSWPLWIYFAAHNSGVTIVRMPKIRVFYLKVILLPFVPAVADGEKNLVLFANGIPNAVPYKVIKKARKLLSLIGDACSDPLLLPVDSHCLFIGDKTIVAIRSDCGRGIYEAERNLMISRRSKENRVFFTESTITWQTPISERDFEDLCLDLVRREPGVIRAKPVGTIYDRDGGRDILIDRKIPIPVDLSNEIHNTEDNKKISFKGTKIIRVIAQVKSRSNSVGKSNVQDIRDTLEHHNADGFLLLAYPHISSALVDHLDNLRRTSNLYTDWWESRDIEAKLRRHPDIAKRYPSLVTIQTIV